MRGEKVELGELLQKIDSNQETIIERRPLSPTEVRSVKKANKALTGNGICVKIVNI